jgi:phosphatidylserine decarboxylase
MRWFTEQYKLDLSEAEFPAVADYDSLNALFTRALRPGARPIASEANAVASPADGILTRFGTLESGSLIQAKGIPYSLAELIGESDLDAFDGGEFATIYLAPHNYHRVHVPIAGTLEQTRYIAGKRFSVNAATAAAVPNLFCRNERAVFRFVNGSSAYYLVMVGALNVASISTATRGEIASGRDACWQETAMAKFAKGAEIGRFNLGSTVIMILPRGRIAWRSTLNSDQSVRMGERLGTLLDSDG